MKEIKADSITFKNSFIYIDDQMLSNPQSFESVEQLQDETANLYIVAETGYGNSAALTLVWAFDESEAVENALVTEIENVCSIEQIEII